jgi:hypothetical protein
MDLSPIDAPEAEQMYNTLADDTKQLSDAVDAGIDFSLTSAGTFNCNTGGCNVLESFTGTLSSNARTRIANGQITARLTVTNVTIDGRPAGGCVSAPTTIPVTGHTHTYYVLAGNTPVLVHNDDCPGKLAVAAQNPSASELRAARYLAGLGKDVILRDPVGTRAGGGTSDLLVDGVRWDVYTPKTANPDRIVSQVASKGSQVLGGGVIIDLSETTVSADQLGNIQSRVAGTGGRVSQIVVMP